MKDLRGNPVHGGALKIGIKEKKTVKEAAIKNSAIKEDEEGEKEKEGENTK